MTDWTTRRYQKDYRNFTGVPTERQPNTHRLHMTFEADDHGVIRTKRTGGDAGTRFYEEYRYYTPEQAEALAEMYLRAVTEARARMRQTRAWTPVGNVGVNPQC